jgi:hypothetical protein
LIVIGNRLRRYGEIDAPAKTSSIFLVCRINNNSRKIQKYKIIQGLVVEKEEGLGAGHGSIVSSSGGGKFKHNIENVYQEKKKKKGFFFSILFFCALELTWSQPAPSLFLLSYSPLFHFFSPPSPPDSFHVYRAVQRVISEQCRNPLGR